MDIELTSVERRALIEIYKFAEEQRQRGIAVPESPSVRELMVRINRASTATANYRIYKLRNKGLLAPGEHVNSKTTRLTDAGFELAKKLIEEVV